MQRTKARWEVTFTVTGFSGFFIRGGSSVVPIKLLDFTAKALGADNLLEWAATAIPPYSTFEITRSVDRRNFEKLDIVAAQGTSYTYYDKKPLTGINYYRLIMKEMPSINTFSHIATERRNEELGGISLWPLPATDMLTISCSNQNFWEATSK